MIFVGYLLDVSMVYLYCIIISVEKGDSRMKQPTSFYLLTDTHFVSKESWVEGQPITMRERGDQIVLKLSTEILDSFVEKILQDDTIDIVLFTGDNVNSGDMASHADFRARLERLTAAGKKVYVICATHDYCSPNGEDECFQHDAVRYTETGTEPTPFMLRRDLFDYYADYGPKQALSVHKESGSYVVRLGDGVRLCMIDDNGNGRSHCGLFEDGVAWLTEQIHESKKAGDYFLIATHHPVIAPWEVYRHLVDYEMYGGYQELSKLMCEEGVRVVFTGHTHVQNIRKYTDEEGRWFVDVSTVSAVNAAGKMRRVTVDPEAGVCEITSVGLDAIKGVDTGGLSPFEYLYGVNFAGRVEKYFPLAKTDFDAFLRETNGILPADKLRKHKALVKPALRFVSSRKLSFAAKFGKAWKTMTDAEKKEAKETKLLDVVFEICRHIYPGNAPFTPDTVAYKALHGGAQRLDRIVAKHKIEKVQSMIPPGSSLTEMVEDFLYNNRTGDDDAIVVDLK